MPGIAQWLAARRTRKPCQGLLPKLNPATWNSETASRKIISCQNPKPHPERKETVHNPPEREPHRDLNPIIFTMYKHKKHISGVTLRFTRSSFPPSSARS